MSFYGILAIFNNPGGFCAALISGDVLTTKHPLGNRMSHSQLQRQVLSLYRQLLRATKHKPGFDYFIRHEFKKNKDIPKRDIMHIEHALRRGKQKLILFQRKEVQSLGVFTKDEEDLTK